MSKTFKDYLEESGLQYYTGVKKHGKEYMKRAAKAGREGASQEELGRIKDKYSKAEKESIGEGFADQEVMAILQKYPKEHAALKQGADIIDFDDLYQELFSYFANSGDMPYDTMKARDGDPYQWIQDELDHLGLLDDDNESLELDRIKTLAGASIDETYDDDDDFYNAYGEMWYNDDDIVDEAEYQGRKVKLGKPMAGDVKKFKVYVKDPKTGNIKKVNFGHGGSSVKGKSMRIRKNNPGARKSFRARHNCDNPGPRTKARYWSCRKW